MSLRAPEFGEWADIQPTDDDLRVLYNNHNETVLWRGVTACVRP